MKTQFDTIIEGQKQMWDFWADATKKMGEAITKSDNQFVPSEAPESVKEWAEMQKKFAQNWVDLYTNNVEKMGLKTTGSDGVSTMKENMDQWAKWVKENQEWVRDNLLSRLPFVQQYHYKSFSELYEDLYRHWEPLRKMMEVGIYRWDGMERFFAPETYRELVGKFMGFKPAKDINDLINQANEAFETYLKWGQNTPIAHSDWANPWKAWTDRMTETTGNPLFKAVLDVNQTVRNGLESLYNVAGQSREIEMARVIKDIQFAYAAFLLKTTELQSMVYNAGQFALPDTLKYYHEEFNKNKQLPDYQTFFSRYTNDLENYMIEVLHSNEYSTLQNEVAKTGIQVKSKLDKLVELAFADFPFLMNSHADEIGKEAAALRKKVRQLEARLAKLEQPNGVSSSTTTTKKKTTKKETTSKPK